MEQATQDPIVSEGPMINGEKTILTLYTHTQLRSYPYMRQFNDMVNKAFSETPSMSLLFPDIKKFPRLAGDDAFFKDIGPSFFTFVCTSAGSGSEQDVNEAVEPSGKPSPPRHFATASGRNLWPKVAKESDPPFLRDMSNKMIEIGRGFGEETDLWELKILAVDPGLQRTGLASLLMRVVEAEAVKQSAARTLRHLQLQSPSAPDPNGETLASEKPRPQRVVMLLDTILEENEAYYSRRGYVAIDHLMAPTGSFNSTKPFKVAFMQKELSLD